MNQPFQGKVALVTGASSGVGYATARLLAEQGATVYAVARRTDEMQGLAPLGVRAVQMDLNDGNAVDRAFDQILAESGGVDILVNNAAFGALGAIEDFDVEVIRRQFEVNVFAGVRLAQLVLPHMRRRKWGRIINVTSMGGEHTTPYSGTYHGTKYAMEAISDSLRYEVWADGIDVVVVQPAVIDTPMARSARQSFQIRPGSIHAQAMDQIEKLANSFLQKGSGVVSPEDVAQVIATAAAAAKPKTRYKVGIMAHLLPLMYKIMPNRRWDAMQRKQLGGAARAAG